MAGVLSVLVDLLSWALLLSGAFFYLVGMVGLFRFPDLFTRMHAVSVSDTLGVILLIFGMLLQAGFTLVAVKLIFVLVLLLVSGPVISHALARAALHDGQWPLIAREDGRLEPTDPCTLFDGMRERLSAPLSSEQVVAGEGPGPDDGPGTGGDGGRERV